MKSHRDPKCTGLVTVEAPTLQNAYEFQKQEAHEPVSDSKLI